MIAISQRPQAERARRALGPAGRAVRFVAALALVSCIAYHPIELCLEPHAHPVNAMPGTVFGHAGACLADDRHHAEDHHERHSAEEHQVKGPPPTRILEFESVPVRAWEALDLSASRPQPSGVDLSGLSPPEFRGSWQFLYRTAPPIRAPSLLC